MNEQKNTVDAKHRGYDDFAKRRVIFQDVIAGTLRLRKKGSSGVNNPGEEYLPKFPKESQKSYEFRRDTATLFNLARKTRDVMVGLVCQAEIELQDDVASEIKTLAEAIDPESNHLDVFARKAFETQFDGYAAVLVDAPSVQANDLEQERNLGLRPYWVLYTADQIWNWRFRTNELSKKKELELIVFREETDEPDGRYLSRSVVRYRLFEFVNGQVFWELWEEQAVDGLEQKTVRMVSPRRLIPRLTQIPVGILGSLGEAPPLLDIALKNIEHFQTYSDYKNIIHKTCVPLLTAKGFEADQLPVGPDIMIKVGKDGDLFFAEPSGSSIDKTRQSLIDMRDDISLMGLSMLADKTARVDLTATEALLNNIGETAELRVMARNLQDCLELCFGHTAEYMGKARAGGGSIVLGTAWNRAEKEKREAEERDMTILTESQAAAVR